MKTRLKTPLEFFMFYYSISDDSWTRGKLDNGCQKCALGHLDVTEEGMRYVAKSKNVLSNVLSLGRLFSGNNKIDFDDSSDIIYDVNDKIRKQDYKFSENNSKNNILNKLITSMSYEQALETVTKYAINA